MVEIAKFWMLFLFAKVVGCSCALVPTAYEAPIRANQLSMYYTISTQGPGGFDDAVQETILKSPAQYASGVAKLLHSRSDSEEQEAGLYFAEYVTNDAAVREELKLLSERHPDQQTKEFIRQLLDSAVKAEQGIQLNGPASGGSAS